MIFTYLCAFDGAQTFSNTKRKIFNVNHLVSRNLRLSPPLLALTFGFIMMLLLGHCRGDLLLEFLPFLILY